MKIKWYLLWIGCLQWFYIFTPSFCFCFCDYAIYYYEKVLAQSPFDFKANYNLGNAFYRIKEFDKAIEFLGSFSASDYLVQARANSLIGDAYMEKEQVGEAVSQYKKASEYYSNKEFSFWFKLFN